MHGTMHVPRDLSLRQRQRVNAHVVNLAGEAELIRVTSPPSVDILSGALLNAFHRAQEETVIQFAVQVHVHRLRLGIVHSGHVIPGVERQRGRSVAAIVVPQ